jgi:hypothetical protein
MSKFVRSVFPMLVVLRLADKKEPVMDKLYFYVRRMDSTLYRSKEMLDELEGTRTGVSLQILNAISDPNINQSEHHSGSEGEDEELYQDDPSHDVSEDGGTTDSARSLGQQVIDIWHKRRSKLVSDYAIAGWLLSPIPEVFADSETCMRGEHRAAVDRLLKKMLASGLADDSDELGEIMNTFWAEFEDFKSRSGHFEKAYIWGRQNRDLVLGNSHIWHKKNSYFQTKVLGRFACRVCSKIVGMGSAERNWGDVKYLKSEKRSHLSPEAVEKQATIFGASCMADAAHERQKAQHNLTDPYKFWDEDDFDNEFDMFATPLPSKKQQRIIKCYFEDWESEHTLRRDDVSKAKLLQKYGGLEFDDIDTGTHLFIDDKDLYFQRKTKRDAGGWCVKAYEVGDADIERDFEHWQIEPGCALHDCLAAYYRKHPEKNVKVVLRKGQAEEIEDLVTSKDDEARAVLQDSSKKILDYCGGCGKVCEPVHKCDMCYQTMHPFCGRHLGEEGHGAAVRCPQCDGKTT